ncbi:MAG: 3-phosphoserine/phosphohydroxythreonine transaminase [Thiolinea sp.]
MEQIYNFSAGPAVLPRPVLEQAQAELRDWQGSGMSVMEISHRSEAFMAVAARAEADLRALLTIPEHYHVLFLQGGASSQFAMVPLNLLGDKAAADYVDTGDWSLKAIAEARRYANINVVASADGSNYTTIPPEETWQCNQQAAYLHYTPNETIRGVEFADIPQQCAVPLIADMSSTLLSRPLDIERFGLIYAGAQKNVGPAGLTLVIVREDLLGQVADKTPLMFDYSVHAKSGSMHNTPSTFSWYMAGLVFQWLRELGGLEAMASINQRKAAKLYQAIDDSDFYHNPVAIGCRSWMNVPFTLADPALDRSFLASAQEAGLMGLKGHRVLGGMRASLYNAMPESGVDALIAFMRDFEAKV